jgi:hypothetical protein
MIGQAMQALLAILETIFNKNKMRTRVAPLASNFGIFSHDFMQGIHHDNLKTMLVDLVQIRRARAIYQA